MSKNNTSSDTFDNISSDKEDIDSLKLQNSPYGTFETEDSNLLDTLPDLQISQKCLMCNKYLLSSDNISMYKNWMCHTRCL